MNIETKKEEPMTLDQIFKAVEEEAKRKKKEEEDAAWAEYEAANKKNDYNPDDEV